MEDGKRKLIWKIEKRKTEWKMEKKLIWEMENDNYYEGLKRK